MSVCVCVSVLNSRPSITHTCKHTHTLSLCPATDCFNLVKADSVVQQRQIGKHNKTAKCQREGKDVKEVEALDTEYTQGCADLFEKKAKKDQQTEKSREKR